MKQLQLFLKRLKAEYGYQIITNWQQDLNNGFLQHVTITGKVGSVMVLFQVYGGENGYCMYIEAKSNTFDQDIKILKGIID